MNTAIDWFDQPEQPTPAAAAPPGDFVWTLTIETKHGAQTSVFRTEQGARESLAAWARAEWPTETAGWPDVPLTQAEFDALPDAEAITAYFEFVQQYEWYDIDSTPLLD